MASVSFTDRKEGDGKRSNPLRVATLLPIKPVVGGVLLTLSNIVRDCSWSLNEEEARDLAIQLNTHFARKLKASGYRRNRVNAKLLPAPTAQSAN